MLKEKKKLPIIILPDDAERRRQTESELKEYEEKANCDIHHMLHMYYTCKKTILEHLLRDGKVDANKLCSEMLREYGSDNFDTRDFELACDSLG